MPRCGGCAATLRGLTRAGVRESICDWTRLLLGWWVAAARVIVCLKRRCTVLVFCCETRFFALVIARDCARLLTRRFCVLLNHQGAMIQSSNS